MKRSHGKNVGRSRKLKSKGRLTAARQLLEFSQGEHVRIDINPQFAAGMPHLRFNHRMAEVVGKQGHGIIINFFDGHKKKQLLTTNVHLAKI